MLFPMAIIKFAIIDARAWARRRAPAQVGARVSLFKDNGFLTLQLFLLALGQFTVATGIL